MHDDGGLLDARVQRELWERVLPLVHRDRRPLTISAGPDLDHLEPFSVGDPWGAPWATTWFRFSGEVPESWTDTRVEAILDLGFNRAPPGFQCEGLVVDVASDGRTGARHGLHPRRMTTAVAAEPGPVEIFVEAASNPSFPQFRPSLLGSPSTSHVDPIYRLRRADLVLVDLHTEALVHDLDVLHGLFRSLPPTDPRREHLAALLAAALDRIDDVDAARRILAPGLEPVGSAQRRHRVTAIGHAHIDTAWLWPMRETVRKCVRTFASAVELLDAEPDLRFVCSQAQQYAWVEDREPELFARITELVADGRWIPVGGMWVESDMNLPSGESLVRQIVFGQRYFEGHFGRRCAEMWIPDVFGYPAGLPQLFAAGGMTRFVTQKLSWNKQNRFPHHTFWWEGLDGSRVLTHFPPVDTYNAELTAGEIANSVSRFREHAWSSESLLPFGYGDGGGGPTREMLERRRRLAEIDPAVEVTFGSPDDFFRRVEREAAAGAPVPVWRGELYFETHRGTLTSQLRTKVGNRRCERLLVEAELWAATAGRDADLAELWQTVLTQQFHDILPGSSIAWVHDEAEAAFERVEEELEERIAGHLCAAAMAGAAIANPADAPIDGVVRLAIADSDHAAPDLTQRVSDGTLAINATAPALGLAPLTPLPVADRVVVTESSMVNRNLAVRWGTDGSLTSLIDLARAREVLPEGSRAAVLELSRDRPVEYDAWDLESWTRAGGRPVDGDVDITVLDKGPLVGRVQVRQAVGPSTFVVTYELRARSCELLIDVEIDWHHDEHLVSMAFPIDVRADEAACDVQFGVAQRPTHPSSPWDAAKFEVCAHRFVDLSEPSFGVAVLNDGRYGHCVFDGAIRVSLARAAKYPDPGADVGRHNVTLALLPHGPGLGEVRAAASRLNAPPRLVTGGAGTGHATPLVRVLGADGGDPCVGIDAVKLADDGSGDLIVRLHEACGDRAPITVSATNRIGEAWRCNLMEHPQRGEEVGDGALALSLQPFELVTLRLRLRDEFDGRDGSG